jgi:hypothetical protein
MDAAHALGLEQDGVRQGSERHGVVAGGLLRDLLALAGGEGDGRHDVVRRFREHYCGGLLVGGQVERPAGLVEARLPGQDDLALQTGGQPACLA